MITVGWTTSEGEQLAPSRFDSVELARGYVDMLNKTEEDRRSGDVWFVQSGEAICALHCSTCEGLPHHWMFDANDEETADEGEDLYPEGRMVCKHCETWRDVTDNDED